jgi:hypothetical protein
MATAPQLKLRDGTGTQALVLSTNRDSIVLVGTADVNTVDVQVSQNGGPFLSDPSLVKFDLPNFTVPNLTNYPTGIPLEPGVNTFLIRTIDIVGSVSAPASATITRVPAEANPFQIPTGIKLRRQRDAVQILAANPLPSISFAQQEAVPGEFVGINVYAATAAGGGTTGYFKVNESIITQTSANFDETVENLASESTTWSNTNQAFVRVQVTEEDSFGQKLATRLDQKYDVSALSNNLRFKSTVDDVSLTEYLAFTHRRGGGPGIINSDQFANVIDAEPLYYVVTAVYYDVESATEIESSYSQEVVGQPLVIDTAIRDLPTRKQKNILVDFVLAIQRANAEISLLPGSTTRDVTIDPFSSEAERLWFILDFVHRSQSFLTLLQIDDANGDGISDPVASSAYKQAIKAALGIQQDIAVQALIDQQFDKLAGNLTTPRLPGRPAIGQVVFYTTSRPQFDIPIPAGSFVSSDADSALGIPSVRFRVGGTFVMTAANADAYFNFDRKRYEITVDVTAESLGEDGNRPAGQIKSSPSVAGLSVINLEATVFGTDRESNGDLAARAMLALQSVDTGTEGGYARTTVKQIGVLKSKIVKSGDPLMMRDYDDLRHKHIGGKVDVWVQGLRERQVSEKFAFTFASAENVVVSIVDLPNLIFRVQDSRVTPTSPIIGLLALQNNTTGEEYNVTGVTFPDYQTFKLVTTGQPITLIDDIVAADYRFRVANKFFFSFQPVRRVVSVVGEVSGPLNSVEGYDLFKPDDPLLNGESTIAADYLSINQFNNIPTGNTIPVSDETHVLIGFVEEPLLFIGVDKQTLRVFSADRLTEYDGPGTLAPDFDIIEGTATTPVKIVRTASSAINSGATVSVDYVKDENFTVTYVINDILQELQRTLNIQRHATADVLVKQAIQNSVELETTVQLARGASKDRVDPLIRSSVSQELDKKLIGEDTAQGDIIHAIDATRGVDYPVVPFARMAYADGSRKLRETVLSTYSSLPSLSLGGNLAYILKNPLQFPTTDGGGLKTEHRGVFQDDESMTLSDDLFSVCNGPYRAYLIGRTGATIAGYTDTPTLVAEGFTTGDSQLVEYLRRSANRVILSLPGGGNPDVPTNHKYAVSYVVRGDSGAKDMTASGVEFLDLGGFTVTYRNAPVG